MTFDELEPDGKPNSEQLALIEKLTSEQLAEIDGALLANCQQRWRKVAAVVGFTMTKDLMNRFPGIPDIFYSQRVRQLVERRALEAQGNLDYMRYSEVRLSRTSPTHAET